jgi:hypothetical protein
MKAQGATEYLVLLAVVLIIALVSVALLGFFPGMASDAQMTQSKTYWQGATPIAVVETDARATPAWWNGGAVPYLRIRNNGNYKITITKVMGNGQWASVTYGPSGFPSISSYFTLAPGEEKYFAHSSAWSVPQSQCIMLSTGAGGNGDIYIYGLPSVCSNVSPYGYVKIPNFGFEYIEYIEGQQITKKQIGAAPLIIKCREPA